MDKGLKISVLGAGNVGATIAYTLTIDGMASEIVLVDINKEKAMGEALDIVQGTPFSPPVNIRAGDYPDTADSDIVVVSVGMGRKPGMTRNDLAQINVNIIKQVIPETVKYAPNAIYIVVSNPVDILTYVITKISGLPKERVIGSGTMLDSARLRTALAQHMHVNPKNVHANVFGEHGDTSVIPWSLVTVAGMPMTSYCEEVCEKHNACGKVDLKAIEEDVRTAGAKVIGYKGATFYAVSLTVRHLCQAIVRDACSVSTISSLLTGQYGISDICLSLPVILGAGGVERDLEPPLTDLELQQLRHSADSIREVQNTLTI